MSDAEHTPDNKHASRRPFPPVAFIGLTALLLLGILIVAGYRLFAPQTRLTMINDSTQELESCTLHDHTGRVLYRGAAIKPGETRIQVLYYVKPTGSLTFQATLADSTRLEGVSRFEYDMTGEQDLTTLSYQVTDDNLKISGEIKPRFRFWDL
ncbi:hypothetical protein Enr10x_01420 [Gimesia panareensis]|uniref:Uncharacterized protein n=1 Tax=Gimesia panareensis TaxID=2527978 RepID=A0A517PZP6_9PLAN|nr:hypothetical protein [Gimesia panareensis]QDT24850.1 hypothetical protein Enr10x_01420 [Gimesia panareensis]